MREVQHPDLPGKVVSASSRDPRVDPMPGDWLSNGRADVWVDEVAGGFALCVRWPGGEGEGRAFRIPLEDFRRQADGSTVIAMAVRP